MVLRKLVTMCVAVALCAVWWLSPMTVELPVASVAAQTVRSTPSTLVGDIDGSGDLNMADAMKLYYYLAGKDIVLTVDQLKLADYDDDGGVYMKDAFKLYRTIAGLSADAPLETQPTVTTTTTTTTATTTTTTTTTTAADDTPQTTTTATTTSSTTAPTVPTAVRGIDVSYAQGEVDWKQVKADNVEFAILRCGYGQDQTDQDDSRWEEYTAACEKNGIPYGAYLFCYARNAEEAAGEAAHALRLLEGKNLTLPVFLDMEYSSWQGNLTPDEYAAIATVFCETLSEAGYKVGVYANLYWWNNNLTDECFDQWYRWVAQYYSVCEYEGNYHMWQYSEDGIVDGIDTDVDMNYCYVDLSVFNEPTKDV